MKKFDLQNTFLYGVLLGSFVNYVFILEIIPAPFPIIDAWGERYFGTVGNANSLAIVMIASIFASIVILHKKKEIHTMFLYYQYINILLAAYMIMLTLSKKGVIFGFLLIFIFLILSIKSIKKPKTVLKLIMLSIIGIVLIYNFITLDDIMNTLNGIERRFSNFHSQITSQHQTKFGSTGERKYFIELGWGLFKDKPLFGYGLDNFREFAHTYSHNNYIELLVGVGLVGMMIFYSIYFFLVKKILRMKDFFLKTIFLAIVGIILLMDFALVSYRNKTLLFLLLFIFVIVELENQYTIKSVDNEKKD
ncbi:O-antigen ligase family protein [Sulfurimonas sp. HSL3-7]|uniref:O-antigen ligase family protein n=1 Tax=Sulfonitrofixus jiaomeiensis TaxID=3131938 RepID=UPI0031F7F2A9